MTHTTHRNSAIALVSASLLTVSTIGMRGQSSEGATSGENSQVDRGSSVAHQDLAELVVPSSDAASLVSNNNVSLLDSSRSHTIRSVSPGFRRVEGTVLSREEILALFSDSTLIADGVTDINPVESLALLRVVPVASDSELIGQRRLVGGNDLQIFIDKAWLAEEGSALQMQMVLPSGEQVTLNPKGRDLKSIFFMSRSLKDAEVLAIQVGNPAALRANANAASEFLSEKGVPFVAMAPEQGEEPFSFQLPKDDGTEITSQSLHGKVVVLYDWASWCMSCPQVKSQLLQYKQLHSDSIELIFINHDMGQPSAAVAQQVAALPAAVHQVSLRLHGYEEAGVSDAWAVARRGVGSFGLPNTVIIDHEGNFVREISGALTTQINSALDGALSKLEESQTQVAGQ